MVFLSVNDMLDTYSGRDRIIRLLCYTTKLLSGLTNNNRLSTFSNLMSECRTTLRLFDDIPMLNYSLSYGLGKKEPDTYMQVCGVAINMLDQLYYPCEHVAWAADKGLISVRSEPWWMASNICWAFSLYFSIARSLRYLNLLHNHNKHLDLTDASMSHIESGLMSSQVGGKHNKFFFSTRDPPECMEIIKFGPKKWREQYKKNSRLQLVELLTGVRCACDLIHAIHWMPEGFLWSGKLQQWHIGLLGSVSSVLSIVQNTALKKS